MKRRTSIAIGLVLAAFAAMMMLPAVGSAQANQLMLADILIALRSKKVPLNERNDIISKAVAARGITFSLTPEIEKELSDTGAAKELIDAIRQKNQTVKVAAAAAQPEKPKESAPPPPDFTFYQKRGDTGLASADYEAAIADYSKAIEMNPTWISSYLGRAAALAQKQAWPEAIRDYDKVIELKPDNAVAHFKRAEILERKGETDLALAGYEKAFSLDAANTAAKSAAERINAEKQKVAKAIEPVVPAPSPKVPEFLQLGALSKEQAVTMAMPLFPASMARTSVGGQVTVEVTIDTDGKVIAAKAVNGLAFLRANSEAAALRSKFKPQTFDGVPVKAKGSITYNFTAAR